MTYFCLYRCVHVSKMQGPGFGVWIFGGTVRSHTLQATSGRTRLGQPSAALSPRKPRCSFGTGPVPRACWKRPRDFLCDSGCFWGLACLLLFLTIGAVRRPGRRRIHWPEQCATIAWHYVHSAIPPPFSHLHILVLHRLASNRLTVQWAVSSKVIRELYGAAQNKPASWMCFQKGCSRAAGFPRGQHPEAPAPRLEPFLSWDARTLIKS